MACGEFAEPIYKLIEELGDTEATREKVLDSLIKFLRGKTIEEFVESFRQDYDMNDDETEDMETQPPIGSSSFFSSKIPAC